MVIDTDGLGSKLDPTFNVSQQASLWRASWSVAATVISIVFGAYTIGTLLSRPWRPTLSFIIILLVSDWFKAFWQFTYSVYWLIHRPSGLQEDNTWCQVEGFFFAWSIEMSDCTLAALLSYVVFGVATRLRGSSTMVKTLSMLGYILWISLPILSASLAFINGGRYTNQSTSCYLPLRPFWYRLGLSWIPRYTLLFTSSAAVLWLFTYVKYKHRTFMVLLKHPKDISLGHPKSGVSTTAAQQLSPTHSNLTAPGSSCNKDLEMVQTPLSSVAGIRTHGFVAPSALALQSKSSGTADSMAADSVTSSADEVLRRLRRLWVYPLVYFLYWSMPLVYHCFGYKLKYVLNPIPALAGISSTFLALQCTFMSAAVWAFERLGHEVEDNGQDSVWAHMKETCRLSSFLGSSGWDKSAEQKQTASFAKQRLVIEQQTRRAQRARISAVSSMVNIGGPIASNEYEEGLHLGRERSRLDESYAFEYEPNKLSPPPV